jgi:hypothetical protein
MQVADGGREGGVSIVVMITPDGKDMRTVVGFSGFKDKLIGIITKGKD